MADPSKILDDDEDGYEPIQFKNDGDGVLKRPSIDDQKSTEIKDNNDISKKEDSTTPKPPSSKPPPVPAPSPLKTKTKKFSKLGDGIEADEVQKLNNMKRIKKRRRSLPIFPTINQLKSVMGFGTDESNEKFKNKDKKKKKNKNNKDNNNNNNNKNNNKNNNNNNDDDNNKYNNLNNNDINDNNNDIYNNDPINYPSSKMLHITNIKLQHQIDKYRTKNKELETEVKLNKELRKELNSQIETKDKLINEYKLQISINEKKIKELQEKVLNRDDIIETLNKKMDQMETNNNNTKNNNNNNALNNIKNIKPIHARSETPGGYKIYDFATPTTPSLHTNFLSPTQEESKQEIDDKKNDNNDSKSNDNNKNNGKAKKEKIKELQNRLLQRHNWKDLHARGILKNNPTVPESLAQAQRQLRARKSSMKIESFLKQRPTQKELQQRNIYKKLNNEYDSDDDTTLLDDLKRATGMNLEDYLKQRSSWKELHARGILHNDPTLPISVLKKKKKRSY